MTTRRQFVQAGLALTTFAVPVVAAVADVAAGVLVIRPSRFVFDTRFAAARALARAAAQAGIPLSATAGDLTDLWYHELDLEWRKAPTALSGITTRPGLFVLETLAADHRMRVVQRDERHDALVSWLIAPRVSGAHRA